MYTTYVRAVLPGSRYAYERRTPAGFLRDERQYDAPSLADAVAKATDWHPTDRVTVGRFVSPKAED